MESFNIENFTSIGAKVKGDRIYDDKTHTKARIVQQAGACTAWKVDIQCLKLKR